MEVSFLKKYAVHFVLAGLVAYSFMFTGSVHCLAGASAGEMIGGFCSVEATTTSTSWSLDDDHIAIQAKKLILVVLLLFTPLLTLPRAPKIYTPLLLFSRRIPRGLIRSGPAPDKTYLPYLFAPHGG